MPNNIFYRWEIVAKILAENGYVVEDDTPFYVLYRYDNIKIVLMKQMLEVELVELIASRIGIPFPDFKARYYELSS